MIASKSYLQPTTFLCIFVFVGFVFSAQIKRYIFNCFAAHPLRLVCIYGEGFDFVGGRHVSTPPSLAHQMRMCLLHRKFSIFDCFKPGSSVWLDKLLKRQCVLCCKRRLGAWWNLWSTRTEPVGFLNSLTSFCSLYLSLALNAIKRYLKLFANLIYMFCFVTLIKSLPIALKTHLNVVWAGPVWCPVPPLSHISVSIYWQTNWNSISYFVVAIGWRDGKPGRYWKELSGKGGGGVTIFIISYLVIDLNWRGQRYYRLSLR